MRVFSSVFDGISICLRNHHSEGKIPRWTLVGKFIFLFTNHSQRVCRPVVSVLMVRLTKALIFSFAYAFYRHIGRPFAIEKERQKALKDIPCWPWCLGRHDLVSCSFHLCRALSTSLQREKKNKSVFIVSFTVYSFLSFLSLYKFSDRFIGFSFMMIRVLLIM